MMRFSLYVLIVLLVSVCVAQQPTKAKKGQGRKAAAARAAAKPNAFDATSTPANKIKVANDFQVELLDSVPKAQYGSWVNLANRKSSESPSNLARHTACYAPSATYTSS